jgi:uracil-DNA glycosylase
VRAWRPKQQTARLTPAPADPRAWGARCDVCPLRGATPVFGDGKVNPSLAVVGEAPGREEEAVGIPFIGKSGEALTESLERAGMARSMVFIDNAVACFPPGGDMKAFIQKAKKQAKASAGVEWHEPVDCCRPRLFFALGIPQCVTCGKWKAGPDSCGCKTPRWLYPKPKDGVERRPPRSVLLLGNAALESVLGVDGIMSRAGYTHAVPWRGPDAMVAKDP